MLEKGIYVGARKRLVGATALLSELDNIYVLAQFDTLKYRESFGWRRFKRIDFFVVREEQP